MFTIHTQWLLKRTQNYPKRVLWAAKRPPKGVLPRLAFFRQPFCLYCMYFVYIAYVFCYIFVNWLYSNPPQDNPPY